MESRDEKDAGELVLASLTLSERLMNVVDSHLQAPVDTLHNHQPISASLQRNLTFLSFLMRPIISECTGPNFSRFSEDW